MREAAETTDAFLGRIAVLADFGDLVDAAGYLPLPDGWAIGLADVMGSTDAIAAGGYKSVNMAGAAAISATLNALGRRDIPYVFGGDGASLALAPEWQAPAAAALAATAVLVKEEFGLDLRTGLVPVAAIRAAGHDVRIVRFAASRHVAYAMFTGGGLVWADQEVKAGRYAIPPAAPGSRPDLTGLSCMFEPIAARRGTILSLIVRPVATGDATSYRDAVAAVLSMVEASAERARPLPEGGPRFAWPPAALGLNARLRFPGGPLRPLRTFGLLVQAAFSSLVIRGGLNVGRFRPRAYLRDLVANSDYRKYDDGLRMTVDCTPALADAIESRLEQEAAAGHLAYGAHRQDSALMTCFTPSVHDTDHVHFVDGAAGGYAAAAARLKVTS